MAERRASSGSVSLDRIRDMILERSGVVGQAGFMA